MMDNTILRVRVTTYYMKTEKRERRRYIVEKKKLQYLNSIYQKPSYDKNNEYHDILTWVYRDENTGEKCIKEIIDPQIQYYVLKPEAETDYKLAYAFLDQLVKRKCKFRELLRDMAIALGVSEDFKKMASNREFGKIKEMLFKSGLIFGADLDIEDFNMRQFLNTCESEKNYLSKSYFDIECDTRGFKGFPDQREAPCPINAITLVVTENKTSYTFLLRNKHNPLIEKLEKNLKSFIKKLEKKFEPDFGKLNYDIRFFDKENQLLRDFMDVINETKPDFCSAWNANFDIQTIMNRWINRYGDDASELMCHPDFSHPVCYFFDDTKHQKYSEKGDYLCCSSYTIFTDSLINFATLRKGLGERRSYKLNDIAFEELGDLKEDYSEVSDNLGDLPYIDYEKFVMYNIKDVLLLKKLEEKNKDLEQQYQLSLLTGTRFHKVMKKTVSLVNLRYDHYLKQGIVPCCNMNVNYTGEQSSGEKFQGAVVCDPTLNGHEGIKINGKKSMFIFENGIDFDLAALYPNIIRSNNIDSTTQEGKLVINKEDNPDNPILSKYADGSLINQFMDSLNSKDYVYISTNFFGLQSIDQLMKEYEGVE